MELLARTDGWRMLNEIPHSEATSAWAASRAALTVVHEKALLSGEFGVHGDCRAINVLLRRVLSSDSYDVRFVDFDGAGPAGVRTYPPFLSPAVQWPAGVLPGEPLKQEHDMALLLAERGS